MSVTADNLVQFVMQNQDQDPLVKKCFQISRTMLSVNSVNLTLPKHIIWKLIEGSPQEGESIC